MIFSAYGNRRKPEKLKPEEEVQYMIVEKSRRGPKPQVDAKFFRQLQALLRIMIPGIWSKESGFLFLVAGSLVARTLCDLWMIQNGTLVERYSSKLVKYTFLLTITNCDELFQCNHQHGQATIFQTSYEIFLCNAYSQFKFYK